jgi:hypothetical protein
MATVLIVHFSQEDRSDRQALKPCSAVFIVIACCSQIEIAGAAPCRFWAKIRQPLCLTVFYRIMNGNEARLVLRNVMLERDNRCDLCQPGDGDPKFI